LLALGQEIVPEPDPVLNGPIFCLASAAGVNNDVAAKMADGSPVTVAWKKMRGRICKRETERLKRSRQLKGGVFAVVEL
jgi:hypothetical protein